MVFIVSSCCFPYFSRMFHYFKYFKDSQQAYIAIMVDMCVACLCMSYMSGSSAPCYLLPFCQVFVVGLHFQGLEPALLQALNARISTLAKMTPSGTHQALQDELVGWSSRKSWYVVVYRFYTFDLCLCTLKSRSVPPATSSNAIKRRKKPWVRLVT